MLSAILLSGHVNVDNGSINGFYNPNVANQYAFSLSIKNTYNSMQLPAFITDGLPKKLIMEITKNQNKIDRGTIKINDDIVFSKQYHRNRIKRSYNMNSLCPLRVETLITRIPESAFYLNTAILNSVNAGKTSIPSQETTNRTALMAASLLNNSRLLSTLLGQGSPLNDRDNEGNTALTLAIMAKAATASDILINAGADVNQAGARGLTPLMLAVINNDVALIIKLSSKKRNLQPDVANDDGNTALVIAINNGADEDVLRALIIRAGVNMRTPGKGGLAPVLLAAGSGNIIALNQLLAYRTDIDEVDAKQWTALMRAVDCQHIEMVGFLLERGANVAYGGPDGETALSLALSRSDKPMIELLCEKGANKAHCDEVLQTVQPVKHNDFYTSKHHNLIIGNEVRASVKPPTAVWARIGGTHGVAAAPFPAVISAKSELAGV